MSSTPRCTRSTDNSLRPSEAPDDSFSYSSVGQQQRPQSMSLINSPARNVETKEYRDRFQCNICDKVCENRKALQNHGRTHVKVDCSMCHKTFYKTSMYKHMRTHDTTGESSKIRSIRFVSSARSTGNSLRASEAPDDSLSYSSVGQQQRPQSLSLINSPARNVETKEYRDWFQCNICDKVCKNRKALQKHGRTHMKVDCSMCHKTFNKDSVKTHSLFFHCDLCAYSTSIKDVLSRHMNRFHLAADREGFKCDFCEMIFTSRKSRNLHIRREHPNKLYKCEVCNMIFKHKEYLRKHLNLTHIQDVCKCEVCNKVFKNRSQLKRHNRMHVEAECPICRRKMRKGSVLTHMKRKHLAANRFQCDLCDFTTRVKRSLNRHMNLNLSHNQEVCKCEVCNKVFKDRDELKRHSRNHLIVECPICRKKMRKGCVLSHKNLKHLAANREVNKPTATTTTATFKIPAIPPMKVRGKF